MQNVLSASQADGVARGKWLLGVKACRFTCISAHGHSISACQAAQCALLVQLITWVQLVEGAFQAGKGTDGVLTVSGQLF